MFDCKVCIRQEVGIEFNGVCYDLLLDIDNNDEYSQIFV
jgi:hypothetical protein